MRSRDLFFGLVLVAGAGWIAVAAGPSGASPAFLVAVAGCGVAGVVHLVSDALVGRTMAGRPVTRVRTRAVTRMLIGVSLVALGVDGYLADGDVLSGVIAGIGVLVAGFAALLWTRGAPDR